MANDRVKKLPPEDIAAFCRQVALVLNAGMPLYEALEVMSETYKDSEYYPALSEMHESVRSSGELHQAAGLSNIFPAYFISAVKIAERSGTLERTMESLGEHYHREAQTRSAVRSAVIYPLVLTCAMALVMIVLIVRVMPIFSQVFAELGADINSSAGGMIHAGYVLGRVILMLTAAAAVLGVAVFILLRTRARSFVNKFLCAVFPPMRDVRRRIAAGRFASSMATLMASGYPLEAAMELAPDIVDDAVYAATIQNIKADMLSGASFADAAARSGLFEGVHSRMITMGAAAGRIDAVMHQLSEIYTQSADEGIHRLVSWIEPSLVAILSMMIGGVLLSVMLPLASIMSSMA